MKTISLLLILFSISTEAAPRKKVERKLYVGKDSVEATMTYRHFAEMESERKPTNAQAHELIEAQVNHLFGPMGEAKQKAVPRGDHEIEIIGIHKKEGVEGTYVVEYSYDGTIVVKVPTGGLKSTYTIVLPNNPADIYKAATVKKGSKITYPCTDEDHPTEGDFWYFWDPKKPGCPLEEGEHYARVAAKVKGKPNTRVSYPKYAALVDKENEIKISMLMGMDDPDGAGHNPLISADENAGNYVGVADSLEAKGFTRRKWSKAEISEISKAKGQFPYVEEFVKEEKKATLRVRLFFGATGIDEKSGHFHYFFKDAIENAAVTIYDGHSGLGGHLDLPSIEKAHGFKFKPPVDRDQIYFFNSCSSYTYYNSMFFGRKATESDPRGIKKLDVLTNGLATYFYVIHDTNMALVKAIAAWASGKGTVSYQTIAKDIDSGNLFGVNGDEDNPKKP